MGQLGVLFHNPEIIHRPLLLYQFVARHFGNLRGLLCPGSGQVPGGARWLLGWEWGSPIITTLFLLFSRVPWGAGHRGPIPRAGAAACTLLSPQGFRSSKVRHPLTADHCSFGSGRPQGSVIAQGFEKRHTVLCRCWHPGTLSKMFGAWSLTCLRAENKVAKEIRA